MNSLICGIQEIKEMDKGKRNRENKQQSVILTAGNKMMVTRGEVSGGRGETGDED